MNTTIKSMITIPPKAASIRRVWSIGGGGFGVELLVELLSVGIYISNLNILRMKTSGDAAMRC
jgi:hypothetical protein